MHHLPSSTDLGFLVGREVIQIAVGLYQAQIHFDESVSISTCSQVQVDGAVHAPGPNAGAALIGLLGRTVASVTIVVTIVDDRHVRLSFADGVTVSVLEDDEPFESYTITGPSGTIVV
jgi:hypothetical protein